MNELVSMKPIAIGAGWFIALATAYSWSLNPIGSTLNYIHS